jgi:hypothetical protein
MFKNHGQFSGLIIPPGLDTFSASDKTAALVEFRKLAFQALELGRSDDVSTGAIALLLQASVGDLEGYSFEEELQTMAGMFRLGSDGVRTMRGRMGVARKVIDGGEYPYTKRLVDYYAPLPYASSLLLSFFFLSSLFC